MQMKLVGVAPVNFTNNVGEHIKGQNIYVLFKDENTNGLKAEKLFLKDGIDLPKDTKLNDLLEVSFNMKGRVCFLQVFFGKSCKIFLENVASPNWRKLQSLDWQLSCQPHSHCRPNLVVTA